MGWPSAHESSQEKKDDAAFSEHEPAADLKKLLIAPVEPRSFPRRSKAPPESKKPKKLTTQQRKYRKLKLANARAARLSQRPENEAEQSARWHLQQLRLMLGKQALQLGPGAPYGKVPKARHDAHKSLEEIEAEIEQLKIILREQHNLLRRGPRSGQ